MPRLILLVGVTLSLALLGHALDAGDEIKFNNLDKINTDADEDDPFVTLSGLTLFYASNKAGTFDILLSKRATANQVFPVGKPYAASKEDDERSGPPASTQRAPPRRRGRGSGGGRPRRRGR